MNTSEEKLLEAVRRQEEGALIELFEFYRPLVEKVKTTYHIRNFDDSDWDQEAMIICYKAVMQYDSRKGCFGAFFKKKLNHHAISLLRRQKAKRRTCDDQAVSLEDLQENESSLINALVSAPLDYINYDLCEDFVSGLSETERLSFRIEMGDEDMETAKREYNMDEAKLKRAKARAYKKMLDALFCS